MYPQHHITQASLVCLVAYFVLMDVLLYQKVKSTHISLFNDSSRAPQHESSDSLIERIFFPGFCVKVVMSDHATNYLFAPLASAFERTTDLAHSFPSLTPNDVSAAGVVFAAVAGRLLLSQDPRLHRLAVLVFAVCLSTL